jgi:hypothetical protein
VQVAFQLCFPKGQSFQGERSAIAQSFDKRQCILRTLERIYLSGALWTWLGSLQSVRWVMGSGGGQSYKSI